MIGKKSNISLIFYNNMNIYQYSITGINEKTLEEKPCDSLGRPAYRADIYDLHQLPAGSFPWHWHREVEFFYVKEGTIHYRIPDRECCFEEGDAGFLNADILHSIEAAGEGPAIQQYHIIAPQLIVCPADAAVEDQYVQPLIRNQSAQLLHFPAFSETAARLRECMDRCLYLYRDKSFGHELLLRNAVSELWLTILENMPADESTADSTDLIRVKAMLHFIETHFAERITLEEITGAACIGKGEGARCFKRTLHMTPFDFLIGYRIDRAMEMLIRSSGSITGISMECGFPSVNYFGKVFRDKTGMTPSEYRKKFGYVR